MKCILTFLTFGTRRKMAMGQIRTVVLEHRLLTDMGGLQSDGSIYTS